MKIYDRRNWDEDDFEIESEFVDVSSALNSINEFVPRVPGRLDRRIREQASYQIGNELSQNWIFTRAPQLALAASLLFGIGVYFVVGLERFDQAGLVSESVPEIIVARKEVSQRTANININTESMSESIRLSSGHSWVKLRFNVDDSGAVREITVIESCLKTAPRDHCIDEDVHDIYAIQQVKLNTYRESGEMEEIIFIPPEYVTPHQ